MQNVKLCIILISVLIISFSCRKGATSKCGKLFYEKDKKQLIDEVFYWLENNQVICIYNSLTKRTLSKYDIYTFSVLVNSFAFRRLIYNLKNYSNRIECYEEEKRKITCQVFFKGARIPLFFRREKTEYIDEKSGKIKKEETLLLELDFDYYITLLDDIKKKYNIDLFYDYYRNR